MLLPILAFGQSTGSFWRIETATAKVGKVIVPGALVYINSVPGWYRVTDTLQKAVTMQSAIDDGHAIREGGTGATQWTTYGSKIYYNTGNVGVNVTNPGYALEINGGERIKDTLRVSSIIYENEFSAYDETSGASGDIIILPAASSMTFGDVIYVNGSGRATLCNAASISTCPYAIAICVNSTALTTGQYGKFMTKGIIQQYGLELVPGALTYVSVGGVSGSTWATSAPGSSNQVIMPIGVMIGQFRMYFFGNTNSVERL